MSLPMIRTPQIIRGHFPTGALLVERWLLGHTRRGLCSSVESPEPPKDDLALPTQPGDAAGVWETASSPLGNGVISDADAVSHILRGRFSSPQSVLRALEERCTANVSKELVDKMLRRFSNDWISAFGFFNWADSCANYMHTRDSYDTMVDILGKARQFKRMWSLVDEMVQLGQLVTLTTMSKVMRRLAGARRQGDAIDAFCSIERFGVKKDVSAMNVILDTLCKEYAVARARDLFMEIRNEIPPDASSFNALIHGWCKVRRFDEARWTMEEMKRFELEPCVISYTSLVEAHCLDGNFCEADRIMDEMEADGCPPNVVTYTIAMRSRGKARKTREALMVYEKMKERSCMPDMLFYNSLIHILANSGRWGDACEVYEEMKRNHISPNIVTYNTMIAAACSHSEEERALKILHEMDESSCAPDVATFAPLLKMKCRAESIIGLQYLLDYMLKRDVSLDLGMYSLLVNRLCRSGCLAQACSFFEEMVRKGFLPRNSSYVMLMEELERKKENGKEKIRKLMAEAHDMGSGSCRLPDKFRNASTEICVSTYLNDFECT